MALIQAFYCVRPNEADAFRVAALPYDVYSREEAKREVEREPLSFLKIDRAETNFPDDRDACDPAVYEKAKELLEQAVVEGVFLEESTPCCYLYELTMGAHVQTGIAACCSVDDYLSGAVRKHENTREDKELDRIRHVDVLDAQTGPILLAYRANRELRRLVEEGKRESPLYDFTSPDGVRHRVFRIAGEGRIRAVTRAFEQVPCTYIADGHHRAASAVKVAQMRRAEHPGYTGKEEFNYFLSVLFPDDELRILPYNRAVRDLNGHTEEDFLELVREKFLVKEAGKAGKECRGIRPEEKGRFGMLLGSVWYELQLKGEFVQRDPVGSLDVSVLQEQILGPVLGIGDPRTDSRIDFIGGIRGIGELERRVGTDMAVAFSLRPTSMEELLQVADAGQMMPPKSTWFEPKLRSGLFIHKIG